MKPVWLVVHKAILVKGKDPKHELKVVTVPHEALSEAIAKLLDEGASGVHEWNSEPDLQALNKSIETRSLVTESEWIRMHWNKP